MKIDREWLLVWSPMDEIMDSILLKAGHRMGSNFKHRLDEFYSKCESNKELKVVYLENGTVPKRSK